MIEWKEGTVDAARGKAKRTFWHLPLFPLEGKDGKLVLAVETDSGWNLFIGGLSVGAFPTADAAKREAARRLLAFAEELRAAFPDECSGCPDGAETTD